MVDLLVGWGRREKRGRAVVSDRHRPGKNFARRIQAENKRDAPQIQANVLSCRRKLRAAETSDEAIKKMPIRAGGVGGERTAPMLGFGHEKARPPSRRRAQIHVSHFANTAIEAGAQQQTAKKRQEQNAGIFFSQAWTAS